MAPEAEPEAESDARPDEDGGAVEGAALDPSFSQVPVAAGFVTLTGRGNPNSEVEVFVQEANVGRAAVDADGVWEFVTRLAQPGAYEISVADTGSIASEAITLNVVEQVILATAVPPATSLTTSGDQRVTLATVTPTPDKPVLAEELTSGLTIAPFASAVAAGFVRHRGNQRPRYDGRGGC